jgi:hypothetical protein
MNQAVISKGFCLDYSPHIYYVKMAHIHSILEILFGYEENRRPRVAGLKSKFVKVRKYETKIWQVVNVGPN